MNVCVLPACLMMLKEARRGHRIHWSWSYKWLWLVLELQIIVRCWEPNLGHLQKPDVILTSEPSLKIVLICLNGHYLIYRYYRGRNVLPPTMCVHISLCVCACPSVHLCISVFNSFRLSCISVSSK